MAEISLFKNALSNYPEPPSTADAAIKRAWAELIRVAKTNDGMIQQQLNNYYNRVIKESVLLSDLCPNWLDLDDHTEYLERAFTIAPTVYLDPTPDDSRVWRFNDVVIPNGCSILANSTQGGAPASNTDNIKVIVKPTIGTAVSCVFDVSSSTSVTLKGFYINGVNDTLTAILAGGDDITLSNLSIRDFLVGYGNLSSKGKTSLILHCNILQNVYGYVNLEDSTIIGGTCISNQYGVYHTNGGFCRYLTRLEFNTVANIYSTSGTGNYYDVMSDAGGGDYACYFENAVNIYFTGRVRRGGRSDSSQSGNFYLKNCTGMVFNIDTEDRDSDSNTPPTTPRYVFVFDGTNGSINRDITITGNLTGYTVAPCLFLGTSPVDFKIDAIGYSTEESGVLPDELVRNRDLGSAAFLDWKLIAAGTRPLAYLNNANLNTTSDQQLTWVNGYSPNKYVIDTIIAFQPSGTIATAVGGFYTGASKTGVTVVDPTQTYTALTTITSYMEPVLDTYPVSNFLTRGPLYFSLTTPEGVASRCNLTVFGRVLE